MIRKKKCLYKNKSSEIEGLQSRTKVMYCRTIKANKRTNEQAYCIYLIFLLFLQLILSLCTWMNNKAPAKYNCHPIKFCIFLLLFENAYIFSASNHIKCWWLIAFTCFSNFDIVFFFFFVLLVKQKRRCEKVNNVHSVASHHVNHF